MKKNGILTYNYDASGALTSDAGRGMARIDYDLCGNPVRIQFTDGSVTRYIYSAAGEKLRVTHLTAVPNITVPIGTTRELAPSEILAADSTDYLLGGTLTMRNGRIDRYLFDEGYCQAAKYASNPVQDGFTPYYFDRDHLGSVRQVIKAFGSTKGTVVQRMEYYPSGLQFCDNTTDSDVQPQRYNGKEYDKMHGLNTYDYGARQYNPVTARWDRMDPLSEKYYSISPYVYCGGNPMNAIDPDGRFIISKEQAKKYPRLNLYLQKGIQGILKNPTIMKALRIAGRFTDKQIQEMVTYGKGPIVNVTQLIENQDGYFDPEENSKVLNISKNIVNDLEDPEGPNADVALFIVGVSILHEFSHYGDYLAGSPDGKDREDGDIFEELAYGKKIKRIDAWMMVNKYMNEKGENEKNEKNKDDKNNKAEKHDDEHY